MDFCSICENNGMVKCKTCDQFELFNPNNDIKKYFRRKTKGDILCLWETDGNNLEPTATVKIGNNYYCPYCGGFSFIVTNPKAENPYKKNEVTGHCCLCEGALAELEYKKKKRLIVSLHERQLQLLKENYEKELVFRTEELVTIRTLRDRRAAVKLKGNKNSYFSQSDEFQECFKIE